uniref:Chondroitin proteoglycan 4 domain-containing protein n=1 Tax=Panagrolaimus sp. ES5 TaxID=591445 RepID=A0AC34GV54_9BILA
MSNSDIYLKYEQICTKLEPAAECSRKCSPLAHAQFHQLSANFRLHCVDFEEELEDHLSCLQKNTVKVEKKCNELCKQDDDEGNIDKQKASCKQNECNLKCHLKGLVEYCPESAKVQKKIQIQKTRELERMREHEKFNLLPFECQQLHDHKHVERILDDL